MEFTRVTKKYVTIPVTATLPSNNPATITGVDVALLPVGYKPTSGTTWTAATYAAGIATILIAGPDADPTGAVVLAAESELWIRVTDSPEVDAVKVTRLSVPSPRPAPAPAVNYVTPAQLAAALAGISGGGGAVASVNGHTGVVVLAATDVGAQAAGSYVTTADARLTDARTPTAHAATHATGGTDPVTPSAIGAAPAVEAVNTVATSGAAQTLPDPTVQSISRITLTANCALTFPTAAAGKSFTLVLVQDATGSRTVTWPGGVKWAGGTAPTLSTGANKIDYLSFVCTDGTNWAGFPAGLDMR